MLIYDTFTLLLTLFDEVEIITLMFKQVLDVEVWESISEPCKS